MICIPKYFYSKLCLFEMTKVHFDKQVNERKGRITMILHAKSFHNKDKIQRAKIGLQLFLSILIITSIILNVVVIITKSMPLIVVYMFTPAFSSIFDSHNTERRI